MGVFQKIIENLPEVASPTQKNLPFNVKLKWTLIGLTLFFVLGSLSLFGLDPNYQFRFEQLQVILGAKFGSIISLGIGPIVTASIVLQLLNGAKIINLDNKTHEGRIVYQGVQKLVAIFFIFFESAIYVFMGGLSPNPALVGSAFFQAQLLLVFQLILGGFMIVFMDEVIQKWGLGSGISLFIAAGVSQSLFIRALSPMPSPSNPDVMVGAIPALFQSFFLQQTQGAMIHLAAIVGTVAVFAVAVYAQSMKVEIPLSFGRVRGHGIRWPLNFVYTSNIPVILVAALMANFQLWARLLQNWGHPWLGTFTASGSAQSGFITWVIAPRLVDRIITGTLTFSDVLHSLSYIGLMMGGAVLFSFFWVQTSGMDARSQAKQMMSSGLQIPGFRKDERVLERLLKRYIKPLTVMGAMTVGFLAASANLVGALANGTGILLTVMIIYKFYEDIAKQHMMDLNPAMRKFMGK